MEPLKQLSLHRPTNQPADIAFSCWCCRDTGIIPGYLVQRYIKPAYCQEVDPPALCSHCSAGSRYPSDRLLPTQAEQCRMIHQTELAIARSGTTTTAAPAAVTASPERKPPPSLPELVKRYRGWLHDPVLRKEAIAWALGREGVELVTDDQGAFTDLRVVSKSP